MESFVAIAFLLAIAWMFLALCRRAMRALGAGSLQRHIEREVQNLTDGNRASLPVIDAAENGYRPVGNERLFCIQDGVSRMEWVSTGRYSYSGMSVSVPVVRGLRVRVGGGRVAAGKEWREVGEGRLLVTNKALAFESDERNDRWTWSQLSDVEICKNGYAVYRRRGKPVLFRWRRPDPEVCAVIDLMLRRVA